MKLKSVLVTGGAGYVGSVLVPKLLWDGYNVKVLDLFLYGENVFDSIENKTNLSLIKGDIRDQELLRKHLIGVDAVIHLACISNDPSFELNPELGKSINLDAFEPLVKISKESGVKRFIYASTSSVYGIKECDNVTEDLPLEPLTDYSKYKAECEKILNRYTSKDFVTLTIRPATVCGYSPRQRLDLTVNILTSNAINKGEITVFGGQQKRPNIHINDITDLYVMSLEYTDDKINGKIFNAGFDNMKVADIAYLIRDELSSKQMKIKFTESNDNRSYHISSDKIKKELGFEPAWSVKYAIQDLKSAFICGKIPNPEDPRYYNIKTMQRMELK